MVQKQVTPRGGWGRPPKGDAPRSEACHKAGMHLGIYYSQPDWHHPDAFTPGRHDRYKAYLRAQLTELLSHYGKIDYLFFDGLSPNDPANAYGGSALNELARQLHPQIILNDRNGSPFDFDTPEQTIGEFQKATPTRVSGSVLRSWYGVLTVNSWNEWTEGGYIEPDTTHELKYLEAISDGDGRKPER